MNNLLITPYEGDMTSAEAALWRINEKDKSSSVCLISLNKTYSYLSRAISPQLMKSRNLLIVDGATPMADPSTPLRDTKNCLYVKPPNLINGLEELYPKVDFSMCKYFIVDSLSTLSIYHTANEVADFVTKLNNYTSLNNCDLFFLTTRVYLPSIMKNLEQRKISIIQTDQDNYVLKFEIEELLDILVRLDLAITDGKKQNAQFLYKEAMQFYKGLQESPLDAKIKKMIYDRCIKYLGMIKKLP